MYQFDETELKYLISLAKQYPTVASACTEIINLQAILNLPKGTEHFLTDIHGEYEQFVHVLKNGSGAVRRAVDEELGNALSDKDRRSLATLIYYPEEKLDIIEETEDNIEDWYKITLHRLVAITKHVASKYTRSKVRKALPKEFSYVIEELITERSDISDKEMYYNEIIHTIIRIGSARDFIVALCNLIQRMVVDQLHIVGDIYDRGPGPHIIMDALMDYHSVDIQWGNHDLLWMGAACGHMACIATVIRIATRYGNLSTLEEGYGINMIPLITFAMKTYKDTDCSVFGVKYANDNPYSQEDVSLDMMIHKAIAILQFKLEGQIIKMHPEFQMEDRLLLDKIDPKKKTIMCYGKEYPMKDVDFPTIDWEDPYWLTDDELNLILRLRQAFLKCEKLQRHIRFLFTNGGLYKVHNSNLLYHGCMPLDENGEFKSVQIEGKKYSGRVLYDALDNYARKAYYEKNDTKGMRKAQDYIWYLWAGPNSPVFGKDKMTTFERYFIEDTETHKEVKNPYYSLLDNEEIINKILNEFGLDEHHSHIINGHVPVESKKGESPIKCNGKLLIIDGGFSKAYQGKTGISGYTLIASSHGMRLVEHEYFESTEAAILNETDIISDTTQIEVNASRIRVSQTDIGDELKDSIKQLEKLVEAYRTGILIEKR